MRFSRAQNGFLGGGQKFMSKKLMCSFCLLHHPSNYKNMKNPHRGLARPFFFRLEGGTMPQQPGAMHCTDTGPTVWDQMALDRSRQSKQASIAI